MKVAAAPTASAILFSEQQSNWWGGSVSAGQGSILYKDVAHDWSGPIVPFRWERMWDLRSENEPA